MPNAFSCRGLAFVHSIILFLKYDRIIKYYQVITVIHMIKIQKKKLKTKIISWLISNLKKNVFSG